MARKPVWVVRKRPISSSGFSPPSIRRRSLKTSVGPTRIDVLLCSAPTARAAGRLASTLAVSAVASAKRRRPPRAWSESEAVEAGQQRVCAVGGADGLDDEGAVGLRGSGDDGQVASVLAASDHHRVSLGRPRVSATSARQKATACGGPGSHAKSATSTRAIVRAAGEPALGGHERRQRARAGRRLPGVA
ncbi:MAG: hypothetical protein R2712_21770 [Vicinamibacterales bacterium]